MAWYNSSWAYRVKITTDNTKVDADLTDYPVYVNLANLPAGFHTNVKAAGADIRVTTSDGTTEVPREVVFYDAAIDTGELHFKAPSVANATDTDFYIYYGNAGASEPSVSATYGRNNVWTEFKAVYHFQGSPTGSAPQAVDSTGNGFNGTVGGTWAAGDHVAGKLSGLAYDNDPATDDRVDVASTYGLGAAATMEVWLDSDAIDSGNGSDVISIEDRFTLRQESTNGTVFFHDGTTWRSVYSATPNFVGLGWTHIQAKVSAGAQKVYVNGTSKATNTWANGLSMIAGNTRIGCHANSTVNWCVDGRYDEVRIANKYLSDGWLTTSYKNQNSPNTFYAVGSEENAPISDSVSPSSLTAALTLQSPSVTATRNVTITPAALSLSAALQASVVQVSETITPAALDAALTLQAPTVSTTRNATVTPSPLELAGELQSSTISLSKTLSPDPLPISAQLQSPSVTTTRNPTVQPSPLTASTTLQAPSLSATDSYQPAPQELALSVQNPTVITTRSVTITPDALAIIAAIQSPNIAAEQNATFEASSFEIVAAVLDPSITSAQNASISPDPQNLSLSVQSPTISTTRNVIVTPDPLSLITSLGAASIQSNRNVTIQPASLALSASVVSPMVSSTRNITVTPGVLVVSTSILSPIIASNRNITIEPQAFELSVSVLEVTISTARHCTIQPNPLTLALYLSSPVITTTRDVTFAMLDGLFLEASVPPVEIDATRPFRVARTYNSSMRPHRGSDSIARSHVSRDSIARQDLAG